MHEHTTEDTACRQGRDRWRWPEQVATEPASDKSRRVSDSLSTRLQKKQNQQQGKKPAASLKQQPLLGLLLLTMMRNINHNARSKASTQIHTSRQCASSYASKQPVRLTNLHSVAYFSCHFCCFATFAYAKETFSCTWTFVCVCVCECGSFCFPSSLRDTRARVAAFPLAT